MTDRFAKVPEWLPAALLTVPFEERGRASTGVALSFYVLLALRCDSERTAVATFEQLAKAAEMSSRSARRSVDLLVAAGAVVRVARDTYELPTHPPGYRDIRSVYFIQAGIAGPVKIGLAKDVAARVAALQTAHSEELRLLGTVRAAEWPEAVVHRRFAGCRIRGEWFSPTAELLAFIAEQGTLP